MDQQAAFLIAATYGSEGLFAIGVISAIIIVLLFNYKTYRLVKKIQILAERDGKEWTFWRNTGRYIAFVYHPESLIDRSDSTEMLAVKQMLMTHRGTVKKQIQHAIVVVVFGVIAAVSLPVVIALIHQ